MINKVDLLAPENGPGGSPEDRPLALKVLDENQHAVIPFTAAPQSIGLHYFDGGEIQGYVQCNGAGCVACLVRRRLERKLLLPVYDPLARSIVVIAISDVRRPYSLRPQITNVLTSPKPFIVFITNHGMGRFSVESRPLPADVDGGEVLIAPFIKKYDANEIDLTTLYQIVPNDELRRDVHISALLKLKGLDGANS